MEKSVLSGDYSGEEERERESPLRPKSLKDFQGQQSIKDNLEIFVQAACQRREAMDHVFISGPPGLGKTTLAGVLANELSSDFVVTSAPALDKPKDLVGLLTSLSKRGVFFIDEIHRLRPVIEEMLYIAMEDFVLDFVIGQGVGARTVRVPVPPFTLIGATTKPGRVSSPLFSRFGITLRLDFYPVAELSKIVKRSSEILGINITSKANLLVSTCSRGTPRIANRLLRRLRDFSQVEKSKVIDEKLTARVLKQLQVDMAGLEEQDRNILKAIVEKYQGGPVGVETLAMAVGESAESLEDFYEPYLVQAGFLQRTSRGRVVTMRAYQHLGLKYLNREGNLF